MKSTYGPLQSISLDTTQEGILSINIQKQILKILCFVALFSFLAYFNFKLAIAISFAALIIRVIVFVKEISDLDLNFTLDNDDLAEIDEQMWR